MRPPEDENVKLKKAAGGRYARQRDAQGLLQFMGRVPGSRTAARATARQDGDDDGWGGSKTFAHEG
jgi:hypothetical protein